MISFMEILCKDLILRPWFKSDIEELVQIANDKSIYDNLRDAFPFPYTYKDAENWIAFTEKNNNPIRFFAIICNDKLIGSIGIVFKDDIYCKNAEIGYYIGNKYRGKGYITQAIQAILKYIFLNFDIIRIYAEPFANNIASRKVLEKNNFICEAIFKQYVIKNGLIQDSCIYSILKSDYLQNNMLQNDAKF
jgi:RimJ/RimL family protein N-acetyltransferase